MVPEATPLEQRVAEINVILWPKGWKLGKLSNPVPEQPNSIVGLVVKYLKDLFNPQTPPEEYSPNSYEAVPQERVVFDERLTPRCVIVTKGLPDGFSFQGSYSLYSLRHIKLWPNSVSLRKTHSGSWEHGIGYEPFRKGLEGLTDLKPQAPQARSV